MYNKNWQRLCELTRPDNLVPVDARFSSFFAARYANVYHPLRVEDVSIDNKCFCFVINEMARISRFERARLRKEMNGFKQTGFASTVEAIQNVEAGRQIHIDSFEIA